jgi:hypothetical protein
MATSDGMQLFVGWAKERTDEMEAILASLEGKSSDLHAASRAEADRFIAGLRAKRDEFRDAVQKQVQAGGAAWTLATTELETAWAGFEKEAGKYFESFGQQVGPQATFQMMAAAQLKAWRAITDTMQAATRDFAPERRSDAEAMVTRIKSDTAAAEEKFQKLSQPGAEPWSALTAALAESRAAFDRANQAARTFFK